MNSEGQSQLSSQETARYSRHILLDELGLQGQEKLKQSKALVIGAGGLGSPVALYLAAAGVGTIGLADFDDVELHNLQRQILHGSEDIGTSKLSSASKRLQSINPNVSLQFHDKGILPENALEIFAAYDIIIDGSDNFSTRYLVNDAAVLSSKPLVYGSIFKFEGQVSLFDSAQGGPCYRCLFPEPPPEGAVPNCGEAGVLGALCGVVGSLQALEAIKRLANIGDSLQGALLAIDTLNLSFRKINLKQDKACPLCGANPSIARIDAERYQESCPTKQDTAPYRETKTESYPLEVDVIEAQDILQQSNVVLLDVREPFERDICKIEGDISIPMQEIPLQLEQLPRDRPILVYCHHGPRSRNVTAFLRQQGFDNATNVDGGIHAWAQRIDQSMQTY